MEVAANQADRICVVFVFQKTEQIEEVQLNSAQLTALLHAKQVWVEAFSSNLVVENSVWSYGNNKVTLQVYLK
ncbi:hypothetical protein [Oceanobacillus manasiensis]|uniref:hypothetical protein n=1 Tax=Oceanobacillus manasiensis TaxID=586413 RepID=UPI0005A89C6F|nr:hypothetical protein [Oceanobacillus manasiensis]